MTDTATPQGELPAATPPAQPVAEPEAPTSAAPVELEPAYVPAGETTHGDELHSETGHEPAAAAGPGMPQLDHTWFTSQLFWLTVSFAVLYVVLARFIMPRIQHVLDSREGTVTGHIATAERMKAESEEARRVYEKALSEAQSNARQQIAEAQKASDAEAVTENHALDSKLAARLSDSEKLITEAKRKAHGALSASASELAGLMVEKLANYKPAPAKVEATVATLAKAKLAN